GLLSEKPGIDFIVYYVTLREQTILGIYVGNAADFSNASADRVVVGGNCVAASISSKAENNHSRDVLITLDGIKDFPRQLHLFYRNLDDRTAKAADSIINSVRLVEGSVCKEPR